MARVLHLDNHLEDLIHLKFSNYLANYTKTACKVCGKIVNINGVRGHIKKEHVIEISEYYQYSTKVSTFHRRIYREMYREKRRVGEMRSRSTGVEQRSRRDK